MLSPELQRLIDLDLRKAEVKKFFDELKEATEAAALKHGIGAMFQDPRDGCVYKLTEPEGTYVHYQRYGYVRTRREGEKRGDLSIKEAEEAGFKA